MAALAGSNQIQKVVDGLLPMIMIWDDKRLYRTASDWNDAAHEVFDITIELTEMESAVERAVESGDIIFNTALQTYSLSPELNISTMTRINESERLEERARASWLAEVEPLVPDIGSESLWSCLITYAGEMFLHHGYEAASLLALDFANSQSTGALVVEDEEGLSLTSGEALYKAMLVAHIENSSQTAVATAVSAFFNGNNEERVKYVTELANSTFNFMTLGIDSETRQTLVGNLPNLTIFIDTNVIFDVIGAHNQQRSASSADLFDVISKQTIPFRLYCHERTLREVEKTIDSIGSWLRRRRWSPTISRSLLVSASSEISSIEARYHQINSTTPTPPEVFLSRYSSIPTLLGKYGISIFRDQASENSDSLQKKAELIAEYEAFTNSKRPGRPKNYDALDHDVVLWLAALRRRTASGKSPLFSGALILSADLILKRFEREVLAQEVGSGVRMVTHPTALLQALRPLLPNSEDYDTAFVHLFSMAEFRGMGGGLGQTINSVAAYLASYEDLPEEIATKILTNSILMNRIRNADNRDDNLKDIVDQALMDESRTLIAERDELRQQQIEVRSEANAIRNELASILNDSTKSGQSLNSATQDFQVDERLKRLEQVVDQLASRDTNITVVQNVNQSTAVEAEIAIDLSLFPIIAEELEGMRHEAISRAQNANDYMTVADIVSAKDAAGHNDSKSLVSYLRKLGAKGLEIAQTVSADVITNIIEHQLGMK